MIAISFACESINLLCGFARDSLADVSSYCKPLLKWMLSLWDSQSASSWGSYMLHTELKLCKFAELKSLDFRANLGLLKVK